MTNNDGSNGSGSLAGYLAGFCGELSRCGYGPVRLGAHLELFTDLCQWTEREGISPSGLGRGQVAAFLAGRLRRGRTDLISAAGAGPLIGYLAGAGVIPRQQFIIADGPAREVLERYRHYLETGRGLTGQTAGRYTDIAGPLRRGPCARRRDPLAGGPGQRRHAVPAGQLPAAAQRACPGDGSRAPLVPAVLPPGRRHPGRA
jgi:hypothetical protein